MGVFDKLADNFKKDVLEEKNIWKTLGYAAGGVGVVAALPVLGAVGAVSGVGAVVGVAGGLAAKHIFDKNDNTKEAFSYEKSYNEFLELLRTYGSKASNFDFEELLLALSALAVATANEEDDISDMERETILTFHSEVKESPISDDIKNIILSHLELPPAFSKAVEYAKNVPDCDPKIFKLIIKLVGYSDGEFSEKEQKLLARFDALWD